MFYIHLKLKSKYLQYISNIEVTAEFLTEFFSNSIMTSVDITCSTVLAWYYFPVELARTRSQTALRKKFFSPRRLLTFEEMVAARSHWRQLHPRKPFPGSVKSVPPDYTVDRLV